MSIHNIVSFNKATNKPDPYQLLHQGPLIEIKVEIPAELENYFLSNNIQLPKPETGHALIDTGASITAVDIGVINTLGIAPTNISKVYTPQGNTNQEMFPIKINFPGGMVFNFKSVVGSILKEQGIIALIGRDVLFRGVFIYNGSTGACSISF
ncbi:MAG: hypothetical protein HQK92_00445 [Nitrospirae bacterium]|nr:hypothetical protein [Nitrospirota bacterium]